ncbi:MAG: energy transducer TonB [Cyanobacteria bacterium J06635_15]
MSPPNPNASPMIWLRHQDPQRLWVKIALISVVVHGLLLWLGFPILMRTQSAVTASEEAVVVPIELVDSPIPPQPAATEGSDSSAIASEIAPPLPATEPQSQSSESQSTSQPLNANPIAAPPLPNQPRASTSSPSNPSPSNSPSNPSPSNSPPNPSPSNSPPNPSPSNSPSNPSPSNPSPSDPASSNSGGPAVQMRLVPRSRDELPTNESDIPSRLPDLIDRSPRRIELAPGTAICTVTNPAVFREYGRSGLTVELRLTVEANGQVSRVSVYEPSSNPAFDEFARCLADQQNLQFSPAQDGGQPVPTTLMLLKVSLSPG